MRTPRGRRHRARARSPPPAAPARPAPARRARAAPSPPLTQPRPAHGGAAVDSPLRPGQPATCGGHASAEQVLVGHPDRHPGASSQRLAPHVAVVRPLALRDRLGDLARATTEQARGPRGPRAPRRAPAQIERRPCPRPVRPLQARPGAYTLTAHHIPSRVSQRAPRPEVAGTRQRLVPMATRKSFSNFPIGTPRSHLSQNVERPVELVLPALLHRVGRVAIVGP